MVMQQDQLRDSTVQLAIGQINGLVGGTITVDRVSSVREVQ